MPSDPLPRAPDAERLRLAQKMDLVAELAPGIAHELNNPLTAILAFSQLLLGDSRLPDDLRDDTRLLAGETDRTQRIIRNLLEFVRKRPPERRPTDVGLLLQSVVDLGAYSFAERQIDASIDVPRDLPPIEIDRALMQQLLLSLTVLATRRHRRHGAGEERARLDLRANLIEGASRDQVLISIVTHGVGETPRGSSIGDLESTAGRRQDPGDDLYVAVAAWIAEAHGGRLLPGQDLDREGLGWGVQLPVTAQATPKAADAAGDVSPDAPGRPADERPAGGGGRKPRVLIVDDEAPIRSLLARALDRRAVESTAVADGDEGLGVLRANTFDVLLVDHRMPRMDGIEFHRRAVELRRDLAGRIVFMTGDATDPDLREIVDHSPARVLDKPFELDDVARIVAEVIGTEGLAEG